VHIFGEQNFNKKTFLWRDKLYMKIYIFFNENLNKTIDINRDLPSKYTFVLDKETPTFIKIDSKGDVSMLTF